MSSWPRRLLARLTLGSLRWRIAGWVALVTLVCTGIGFAAVYSGTGSELRHQIDVEMKGDQSELAHAMLDARARTARELSLAASRYIANQPFSASSTLLYVLVPGQPVSTNRPELLQLGATRDNAETSAEQAAENRSAAHLVQAADGFSKLPLPDVGDVRLLKRSLLVPGGFHLTIGVAEPLAAVSHAQRGVATNVHPRGPAGARRRAVRRVPRRHAGLAAAAAHGRGGDACRRGRPVPAHPRRGRP